jgi:uncharacterized protein YjbI with pentapeptide repeats
MDANKQTPTGAHEGHHPRPLQPNMFHQNVQMTSSTWDQVNFDHSIFRNSDFTNSLLMQTNLEGAALRYCRLDGAVIEACSLRAVEFVNCDVEGLVINGIHVGRLLKAFCRT